jgi:hypothetical protein
MGFGLAESGIDGVLIGLALMSLVDSVDFGSW